MVSEHFIHICENLTKPVYLVCLGMNELLNKEINLNKCNIFYISVRLESMFRFKKNISNHILLK